jgi:hypothetical protein
MARYGLTLACQMGKLPKCNCDMIYPLSDSLPHAKRLAVTLFKNRIQISPCERYYPPVERFIDQSIKGVIDTQTWEVIPLTDKDIYPELYK